MAFVDRVKNLFNIKTKAGYLNRDDFGLVGRLFGREWSDRSYLEAYGKSLYVYACVSKIAEKVASINLKLLKITNSQGDTQEIFDHPALDLLYKMNPFYTKEEFIETDVINRKLTGDSFILKIRNTQGQVVELWNVRPDLVSIFSDPVNFINRYEILKADGGKVSIQPQDMIHIKYPSPLETFFGLSPLSSAKTRVDTEQYATEYQRDFFLNNGRPDAVIEIAGDLDKEQKAQMLAGWDKSHKGRGKSSKIGLLTGGAHYNQISLSQREMDYIESLKFTRDDILVVFKVPKPIVAVTDDVNRANAETAQRIFLGENIIPEMRKWVNKLNEELISPDFGEEYYLDFDDPMPLDRETKLLEYQAGIDKWITINEVRQDLGLEPIKGGDSLFRPLTDVMVGTPNSFYQPEEVKHFNRLYGKRVLKAKLKMREEFKKEVIRVEKIVKEKVEKIICKAGEISKYSLFKDKEKRKQYCDYKIKDVDRKSKRMKTLVISLANQEKDRVIARLKKTDPKTKPDIKALLDKENEINAFKKMIMPLYISIFKEAGDDALSLLGIDKPLDLSKQKAVVGKNIMKLLEARALLFAKSVVSTTLDKLVSTLTLGIEAGEGIPKLTDRIQDVYGEFSTYRAETIARTETNSVVNEANIEAYDQSDVVKWKEWVATLDDRVRDEHLMMDGEIVKLHDNFSNGLDSPSEPNCRCTVAPVANYIE